VEIGQKWIMVEELNVFKIAFYKKDESEEMSLGIGASI
jgi:hypothetical protein